LPELGRPHFEIEEEVPRTRGQRALRHASRGAGYFLFATIPIIVLLALAVGLGYVRLLHGPISLGVLVEPLERSINAQLDGFKAQVGDAIVMLTDDGRLEFRLANVSFAEPDGDLVASAPLAAIEISHQALLSGQLSPSRVELIEPRIYATYSAGSGLALSFSAPATVAEKPIEAPAPRLAQRPLSAPQSAARVEADVPDAATLKRLDLMRLVAQVSTETRSSPNRASYLREFGLRNATVHFDNEGRRSVWKVEEVVVDLERRKRHTIISGRASVRARRGPWVVAFNTEERGGGLFLNTLVRDLVPAEIAAAGEALSGLAPLDIPVGANIQLGLSQAGEITSSDIAVELGRGQILVEERNGTISPIPIDAGLIKLSLDPVTRAITLAPSTINWAGGNSVTLTGAARREAGGNGGQDAWVFTAQSTGGTIAAGEFSVGQIAIGQWEASGRIIPTERRLEVGAATLRIGNTDITATAEVSFAPTRSGFHLDVNAKDIPIETLKALWAPGLAPKSRRWVGRSVLSAQIDRLNWRLASGVYLPPAAAQTTLPDGRLPIHVSLAVDAHDAVLGLREHLPPVKIANATVRLDGDTLEVALPQAMISLPSGASLDVQQVKLTSADVHREPPDAVMSLKSQSPVASVIELLSQGREPLLRPSDLQGKRIQGKVDADLTISFPMVEDVDVSRLRMAGKAKLTDGRAQNVVGDLDLQGGTVAFDFNSGAVEARGEALIKGVPIKIAWQRIFDAAAERQPPLRITATLDDADRKQLGFDLADFVHGEVPLDVQVVTVPGQTEPEVHVRADLTSADLALPAISFRKPPGRSAFMEFDVVAVGNDRRELRKLRIAGDSIAVEGTAEIGPDRRLRSFDLPEFSLNVVTHLKLEGKRGNDNIWKISAKGPTFDGKEFFRSLFVIGRSLDDGGKPDNGHAGIDLEAEIDTVLGFSDISLRGLRVSASRRGGKLNALEARGNLADGNSPIAVVMDHDANDSRRLRADTTDAGQAFRLIGFYPNMQNGRARLEINLDGKGAADKTGILWVENFRVLGDPVVSEVVSSVDESRPKIGGKRRVVREVFEFDAMRVPFSIGHGQVVMEDAYVRGPLVGATIRGKIDYTTQRMTLGGTYIPLQGLNNAFGQIPVLGQILSGPRGEGIFGITFAIQGAMSSPQVLVNPLSLVAPGIFREVFQMTGPDPQVLPRSGESRSKSRLRKSSGSASAGASSSDPTVPGTSIDGWNSETKRR